MRLSVPALVFLAATASAQTVVRVRVISAADSAPLARANVAAPVGTVRTGEDGIAELTLYGAVMIQAARFGFARDSVRVDPASVTGPVTIALQPATELEAMIVAATRSERRIEDDPLRVEVLGREEIEEKLRMTPGDITMMMNETPGLRVQVTSPSLGGANVRVQGMRGRYTQILSDGLPLFGAQTGGLGLLQIPPMDLGGVEIIKGVASALYGGNAMGGVINLRSRLPEDQPVTELLLNQNGLYGSDGVAFTSRKLNERFGASGLFGLHAQETRDFDSDGWADLPKFTRVVARPRLYWNSEYGNSVILTAGTTHEDRKGGALEGATAPDGSTSREELKTARYDVGGVGHFLLGNFALNTRGSMSRQVHGHVFDDMPEDDRHLSTLGEISLTRTMGTTSYVIGGAYQEDHYRNDQVPAFDYQFTTPGWFVQATADLFPRVALTASHRTDYHSEYGRQHSQRVSALLRAPREVTARFSVGTGYFAPTPFTEETEATGLDPVAPFSSLVAERASIWSADISRVFGPIEANATFFGSKIKHPVTVEAIGTNVTGNTLRLVNVGDPTETRGVELLSRLSLDPVTVTASYTMVDAREYDPGATSSHEAPLTPRHQAGIVTSWESDVARAGLEVYYTGRQHLEDNPYRLTTKPYTHIGFLVERRFGRARIWLNAENLLDVRQTKWDRLVRPSPGPGGRWTTDAWAPLDGRTANIGVRWSTAG